MVDFLQRAGGNSASTTLASGVTDSDTSLPLTSDTAFLAGGGLIIVDEGESTEELAYYTGKSGGALTVPLANRGLEGGSAQPHAAGATVKAVLSADQWNNVIETLTNGFSVTDGSVDTTKIVSATDPILNGDISGTAFLDEDTMSSNSATKVASQQSIKAYADSYALPTGWVTVQDTLVYASATTFTIAGVDRTSTYTPGTKLIFVQTTNKYFYVVSSTFSTNTTVTVTGGSDYTIANAAITFAQYSYADNPQGFPDWFEYTPTFGGFSTPPSEDTKFRISGRTVTIRTLTTGGTSNANTYTMSLPVTAGTYAANFWNSAVVALDNSINVFTGIVVEITSGASTLNVRLNGSSTGWTASGAKRCNFVAQYEI